jgi:flagellar biosynthesis/type III secretory pathway protein FliH
MADYLRTAIIVIHQLPRTPETLWLRILGKGTVQKQAIDELAALPVDNPLRTNALKLLYNLQRNLGINQTLEAEDRELIMRLAPLYEQDREQAIREGEQRGIQQGMQQGERLVVENLLRVRFGLLDEQLTAVIDPLLTLTPEEFTPLLLQLSREELIARFNERQQ